jgi:integrase
MSVQPRKNRDGTTSYEVRWREPDGTHRSRRFSHKRDARDLDAQMRLRLRSGEIAPGQAGRAILNAYVDRWFDVYGIDLAESTLRGYRQVYDTHVAPYLGSHQLRQLTPAVLAAWKADRSRTKAGVTAVNKALVFLSGVFKRAEQEQELQSNPLRLIDPLPLPLKTEIRPLAPLTVETMRQAALTPSLRSVAPSGPDQRPRRAYTVAAGTPKRLRHRDATLLSVLAYAGLRPQEALALKWGDIRSNTVTVVAPKTARRSRTNGLRTVRLLTPLKTDLNEYKLASGRPSATELVFPNQHGERWSESAWRAWRRQAFDRYVKSAGLSHARPYDLRHSFASLLLHEGRSVIDVARQLGHGAEVTLRIYGHVIDELEGEPQLGASDAIARAREEIESVSSDETSASGPTV